MLLMNCVPALLLVLQEGAAVRSMTNVMQRECVLVSRVRAGHRYLQSLAAEADWLLLLQEKLLLLQNFFPGLYRLNEK
jgi:hypothetical protein